MGMRKVFQLCVGALLAAAPVACDDDAANPTGVAAGRGGLPTGGAGGGTMTTPSLICGPQTCAGCCRAGVCEPGDAASACGRAGASCSVCSANSVCTIDRVCAADVNLDSKWTVQPASATVAASPAVGQWDPDEDTMPDVMVLLDCKPGGLAVSGAADEPRFEPEARTGASSSLVPMWSTIEFGSCTLTARELLAAPIRLRLFDDDSGGLGLVSDKDAISEVLVHQVTSAEIAAGGFTLPPSGLMAGPLTVKLNREP